MEAGVPHLQGIHQQAANALPLHLWMHQHVRVIDHQMTIGNGIAQAQQAPVAAGGDQAVGVAQRRQ